jgi:hypothetical protein
MDPRENLLHVYKELADWYERQRQPPMRDRFLVLAADAALLANRPDEAEALKAPDVLTYVKDLRVNYPANVAEDLLRTLQTEDKRSPGGNPAQAWANTAAIPVASNELFLNSKEAQHDLAPTAPPGALPTPYPLKPDSRPQTLPLQAPVPNRPGSLAPPRHDPIRPRSPLAAPLPFAVDPAPTRAAAEPSAEGGSWLTVLLFLLVVASGAALVGFTFLRPYLSMR